MAVIPGTARPVVLPQIEENDYMLKNRGNTLNKICQLWNQVGQFVSTMCQYIKKKKRMKTRNSGWTDDGSCQVEHSSWRNFEKGCE